jgi:hypothetical protein
MACEALVTTLIRTGACATTYVTNSFMERSVSSLSSVQLHSGTVPFEGDAEGKTLIGILQGTRPPRPFRETGCLLEPADGVWDIVSSCWHQDASARPPMSSVCERLKTILLDKESTPVASEDGGRKDSTRYEFVQFPTLWPSADHKMDW